jgi:hypothetical protein
MTLRLSNTGTAAATGVKVRLRSTSPAIRLPRIIAIPQIGHDRTAVRTVRIRITRGGDLPKTARLTARVGDLLATARVRIRPAR